MSIESFETPGADEPEPDDPEALVAGDPAVEADDPAAPVVDVELL
jgi:hypothetical protein